MKFNTKIQANASQTKPTTNIQTNLQYFLTLLEGIK